MLKSSRRCLPAAADRTCCPTRRLPMFTPEANSSNTALGRADLDGDHDRLFALLAALQACRDADLGSRLADFGAEAKAHFAHEDRLMESADFATKDCHVQEHAAVLASLAEVRDL